MREDRRSKEQVKRATVDSAREACCSVRVGGENPKNVCWNEVVKVVVERKELGARNEVANDGSIQRKKEKD